MLHRETRAFTLLCSCNISIPISWTLLPRELQVGELHFLLSSGVIDTWLSDCTTDAAHYRTTHRQKSCFRKISVSVSSALTLNSYLPGILFGGLRIHVRVGCSAGDVGAMVGCRRRKGHYTRDIAIPWVVFERLIQLFKTLPPRDRRLRSRTEDLLIINHFEPR